MRFKSLTMNTETCIAHCTDREGVLNVVKSLPEDNRLTLTYLIRFLQVKFNTTSLF